MPIRSLVLALLSLAACQAAPDGGSPPPTGADGTLPRPYTAEQIRAAHPNGTLLRLRLVQPGREMVQLMRFDNADDEGVDVVSWVETPAGQAVGARSTQRSSWVELRDHAAFAAAKTRRRRSRCDVPAGAFDCWLYTVASESDDEPVSHFHFADGQPGPPVLVVMERDGAEVMRAELLEYRRGG